MCGVCGLIRLNEPRDEPSDLIDSMTDALAHRGPSDRGTWRSERALLGNRRLAVRDLTTAGHQPMLARDGTLVLTYNGEVYNSDDLRMRHALDERGYSFRSSTDTEVILYLFAALGTQAFAQLDGMFAIAIWDELEESLYLARDRFGIKPLFYQRDADAFRFGSEIKSILADSRVPRRPSMQALHDFLSFDYIPGAQSAFEGVLEVPPGHCLQLRRNGDLLFDRFSPPSQETDPTLREHDVISQATELLEKAVERQLVADVPVGVLLSGGLDSSALVSMMSPHTRESIHTYAIGFDEPSFDERSYARMVAHRYQTQHTEVVVRPEMVRDLLTTVIRSIDEPYADGSAIPTYCISEIARQDVVVLLSGEGGDEIFGGYETYAAYHYAEWFRRLPRLIRRGLLPMLVNRLPVSDTKLSIEFRLKRFLGGQDLSPPEAHFWWRVVLTEAEKAALYTPGVREHTDLLPSVRHFTAWFKENPYRDTVAQLMRLDRAVFLPDDLMVKNDRMTMAHSIEARVPFTDRALVQFMDRVPGSLQLKHGRKKHILRQALRGRLPEPILRKKKVGLEMPYSRWFKTELRDLLHRYLSPERVHDTRLFRPAAVAQLVSDHLEGRRDNGRALWGLLSYMVWLEALHVRVD